MYKHVTLPMLTGTKEMDNKYTSRRIIYNVR